MYKIKMYRTSTMNVDLCVFHSYILKLKAIDMRWKKSAAGHNYRYIDFSLVFQNSNTKKNKTLRQSFFKISLKY